MRIKNKLIWPLLWVAGCSVVKQIGDRIGTVHGVPVNTIFGATSDVASARMMDKADEDKFGRAVAVAITNTYRPAQDPRLVQYVNLVGLTLVDCSDGAGDSFVFGVLEDDRAQAYSAPGGYVFVTRGLLNMTRDESELAGVRAHELTHVIRHHGLEAVKNQKTLSTLVRAGASAGNVNRERPALDGLSDVILKTGYDRPQESAADAGAINLVIAAGYDPHGLERFLQRLEVAQAGGSGGGLMSTHPATHDRVAAVTASIAAAGNPGGAVLADRYRQYVPAR